MFVGIAFINAMLVSTLCGSEYVQAGPITVLPDSLPLLRTHCIREDAIDGKRPTRCHITQTQHG